MFKLTDDLPKEKLEEFCRKHHVKKLALFDTALRNESIWIRRANLFEQLVNHYSRVKAELQENYEKILKVANKEQPESANAI